MMAIGVVSALIGATFKIGIHTTYFEINGIEDLDKIIKKMINKM